RTPLLGEAFFISAMTWTAASAGAWPRGVWMAAVIPQGAPSSASMASRRTASGSARIAASRTGARSATMRSRMLPVSVTPLITATVAPCLEVSLLLSAERLSCRDVSIQDSPRRAARYRLTSLLDAAFEVIRVVGGVQGQARVRQDVLTVGGLSAVQECEHSLGVLFLGAGAHILQGDRGQAEVVGRNGVGAQLIALHFVHDGRGPQGHLVQPVLTVDDQHVARAKTPKHL